MFVPPDSGMMGGGKRMEDVKDIILKFAQYGRKDGEEGISRVFGSCEYRAAAEALCQYMKELSMESWIDSVGNVHGVYGGREKKAILLGSHLDTVKNGGMFDGLLGIAAALSCVSRLSERGEELPYAIHVIATNGEEGNELGGTFGSRCLAGEIPVTDTAFLEKAARYGISSQDIVRSEMDFGNSLCYLELHIEQGNHLQKQNRQIGLVGGIVGLRRYLFQIQGMENHSGTTMMEYRKDALVYAAQIITYGDELARGYPQQFVATFGSVKVSPNVLAVINGRVEMVLECRCIKEELMEKYVDELSRYCREHFGEQVSITPMIQKQPVEVQKELYELLKKICEEQGTPYLEMVSGATHDGNIYAHKIPIGMIFVPSKDGISHSGKEWTEWEQCRKGTEILYGAVLALEEK